MKLSQAARYFDRLPVTDGYTGTALFDAQFDLYDDSRRDALNVLRRVLSVAPDVSIPARHVIHAGDARWIVGTSNSDTFGTSVIRKKHVVHRVHSMCTIRTAGQAIDASGGSTAYAGLAWMKDWKEAEYGSRVYPYYEIYFAPGEPVAAGTYLELGTGVYRVRSVYTSEGGFLVAEADDIAGARQAVTLAAAPSYNPATDSLTVSSASRQALVMRFTANFEYLQESAPKRQEGDLIVLLSKAAQPGGVPTNSSVLIGARSYLVVSRVEEDDAWRLHVRP